MGKKVNPRIFRMGLSEKWRSRWFATDDFAKFLEQDTLIRKFLRKTLVDAGLDRIDIERSRGEIIINMTAAKPGFIIGRGGAGIEELKKKIKAKLVSKDTKLSLNISEVTIPFMSATVLVEAMKNDLEKRMPFRRVMKQTIDKAGKAGAKGVKVMLAGRLNGVDIARTEKLVQGKVPLQTLRADIDYSRGVANTTYGVIGIKVWVYKGEYFDKKAKDKSDARKTPVKSASLFSKEKPQMKPIKKAVKTAK